MRYGPSIFDFNYDANDRPIGFKYTPAGSATGTYYYYGVNVRGDIEALYNTSGTQIASYSYDAYGKPINTNALVNGYTTVIEVQPLRYRSYVYDTETGLYYLQSRYYDPTTCRFINADILYETGQGINGYNMFAYCNNNPIQYLDSGGKRPVVGSSSKETSTERALSLAYMNNNKVYTNIDDAAIDIAEEITSKTLIDNNEYAVLTYSIGSINETSYYINGYTIKGNHNSVEVESHINKHMQLAAVTHSHPYCNGHLVDGFSFELDQKGNLVGDAGFAKRHNIPIYLVLTNYGELLEMHFDNEGYSVAPREVYSGLPKDNTMYTCIY